MTNFWRTASEYEQISLILEYVCHIGLWAYSERDLNQMITANRIKKTSRYVINRFIMPLLSSYLSVQVRDFLTKMSLELNIVNVNPMRDTSIILFVSYKRFTIKKASFSTNMIWHNIIFYIQRFFARLKWINIENIVATLDVSNEDFVIVHLSVCMDDSPRSI